MMLLYYLTIGMVTTFGLILILKSFLTSKRGKWGWLLFSVLFCLHDLFSIYISSLDIYPIIYYIEFCSYYLLLFIIIKFFFQGNGVNNFIWMNGANFIYQAFGTVMLFVIMGISCDFDAEKIERMNAIPSAGNYLVLLFSLLCGIIIGRLFVRLLLKRNNRVIQVFVGLMAMGGMLAGVINSVDSFNIIFPFLIITLAAGILYQDNMLRVAEKQEQYYHQLEERQKIKQEELAKIRHDLVNHISIIDSTGSTEYAKEVLARFDERIKSGDPIVDCLLDEKERICKEKGIHFQEQVTNLSDSIVSNFDWVSLLANLLDNAIEACEKVSSNKATGDKVIHLDIKRNRDYILISLDNSKCIDDKPIQSKFMTTKDKNQSHGYGTKIIGDIVEKYQGRIRYEDEGKQLSVHITMKAW